MRREKKGDCWPHYLANLMRLSECGVSLFVIIDKDLHVCTSFFDY